MSKKIKQLYRKAGLKPPKGKGIHTDKFHRCVVGCATKQGGKIKGKVNCHPVCMATLGKEGAVKKKHQRKPKYTRRDSETDILNSPFSRSLGWVNPKGELTKAGREVAGQYA